jgi:hypothetical protein
MASYSEMIAVRSILSRSTPMSRSVWSESAVRRGAVARARLLGVSHSQSRRAKGCGRRVRVAEFIVSILKGERPTWPGGTLFA